jgi:hypothetical protein
MGTENKTKSNVHSDEQIKAEALRQLGDISTIDPTGWIEIDRKHLSYEGELYDSNYRFSILPCNAGLLKYFSTIDENNAMSVQDALIYVIKNHVRVYSNKKLIPSEDVIYEHDRLAFTLLVHQYSGSPTNLIIKTKTPSGNDQDEIVTANSLLFTEIPDDMLKYLKNGVFEITTKSFGTLIYKPLTISESLLLTEYIYTENQKGTNVEPFFIQSAPFFINDINRKSATKIYNEYYSSTQDMRFASVLTHILSTLKIELKLEIKAIDVKTKEPFRAPVTSLRGIKDIFIVSDTASELQ